MPPVLYLIDGHALAYRTYFALTAAGGDRWRTRNGEPTAGVFGFTSVLLRLMEQERPEYMAVAFDTGKTFRDKLYPEYKATRAKMPEDLRPQIDFIREVVDAFHFPRLEVEGFEADDVLGSIASQAAEKGFGVKIITGDRDLLQLVNQRVMVNLAGSKLSDAKDYTPEDVAAYLGVRPDQVVDYKALVGDQSDNIPGVPGIGEKTATSLYQKYATLDEIYLHLEELPERVRSRLSAGRESAYLSQKLAQIRIDVPISLELEDARTNHMNISELDTLFHRFEFRSLIDRLKNLAGNVQTSESPAQLSLFGTPVTRVNVSENYIPQFVVVDTSEKLTALVKELEQSTQIALDTETTSTNAMQARLVGISLAVREGEGFYIPVGHNTSENQLPLPLIISSLKPCLTNPQKEIIGHNLKYDALVLSNHGLMPSPLTFDTMIAEWLIDPGSHHLGLKDMADVYLNIRMTHIEELIGKGKNQISMADVPIASAAPYAAADAEVTFQLKPVLQKRLDELNAGKLFREMEMPLVSVLAEIEKVGVVLDVSFFKQMSGELETRVNEIQQQIFQGVGYSFNLNSTQQLSKALFTDLHLPPPDRNKKTASGHFSTSAEVLEQLQGKHPVIDWMLEYRELTKLKSTYVDTLPAEINPATGRVHTSFNQTGSVTGRLASSEPNLQNIPTRTDLGRKVRQGFIASPGKVLLSVDYSQIELRIVAHMSKDEAMLSAFRKGEDIHAATAAAILNIPLNQVSKEQRRSAKAINFGLIYGMSAFGLSTSTGLTLGESENFVKAYFQQFPGVKQYLDGIRIQAASQGYVETLLGRRRYFPNLRNQSNANIRNREEREAINAPIQGTAADIIKIAMIRLPDALKKAGLKSQIALQVHDELILECPQEELPRTAKIVRHVMETAFPLSIPLLTEARSGQNWGEMRTYSDSDL